MNAPAADDGKAPGRARVIMATIIVLLVLVATWAFIEYRSQPPPPPNPVRTSAPAR